MCQTGLRIALLIQGMSCRPAGALGLRARSQQAPHAHLRVCAALRQLCIGVREAQQLRSAPSCVPSARVCESFFCKHLCTDRCTLDTTQMWRRPGQCAGNDTRKGLAHWRLQALADRSGVCRSAITLPCCCDSRLSSARCSRRPPAMRASPRCALAGLGGCACAGERAVLHNRTMPWPPPLPAGPARGSGGGRCQRRRRSALGHCEDCGAACAGAQGRRRRTLAGAGVWRGALGRGTGSRRAGQRRRRSLSVPCPLPHRKVNTLSLPSCFNPLHALHPLHPGRSAPAAALPSQSPASQLASRLS